MKIWAHTLFKNEERWLWYSVTSVIKHVDKLLLWDTGSTDRSWEIALVLKEKYPDKIDLKQYGKVTSKTFPRVRQKMLDATDSDWILIIDADEIWWKESIEELVKIIKINNNLDSIVSKSTNPVGDIFHFQSQDKGKYKIDDETGHLNIRAINRNILGLKAMGEHGKQGYYDENNVLIQERDIKGRKHLENGYLHTTNLVRSSNRHFDKIVPKRSGKFKYETGDPSSLDFYYPEVFFREKPEFIESPWKVIDLNYTVRAKFEKPFKLIKQKLIFYEKIGY